MANAVYGWFGVPESLAAERRVAFSLRRANPVGALDFLRREPALPGSPSRASCAESLTTCSP